ncbi:MAG: UDP-N-acetylmuramoyl-L-alanine--D-glutamate ligase [Burkholderiaceae bacterium]|jgi:UDP-N-acetylmuramoylalanine--D-glutamate ligase
MTDLINKSVLVLGLGESGLAMALWCRREGAHVKVADSRDHPPAQDALACSHPDIAIHTGGFAGELLEGVDLIAISPGLAPSLVPQRTLLDAARERGIPVWGEIEFFARKLADLKTRNGYAPWVIAITGTNGKTTVTSLTGKLCAKAGLAARVAGNISPAALDALGDAIEQNALPEVWVLELSSFQLETALSFAPDAAAILNVTQDHLDWHGTIDAYAAAKSRILTPTTEAVLNRADARVMAMQARSPRGVVSFGMDAPSTAGSFGVIKEQGARWLAFAEPLESESTSKRAKKAALPVAFTVKRLMPVEALQIRGDHNAANALAALALCHAIGLPLAPLLHGLRDYRGEPHRVETIATIEGVEYIDDSKGTNVGATVAALEGLGRRIVLIAGGDGKGQDFAPLGAPVARHARAVILIGKDAGAIAAAIAKPAALHRVEVREASSLEEAVRIASRLAEAGEAVLLSPACASLDMFRNYKHRAQVFAAAVHGLNLEAPAPC